MRRKEAAALAAVALLLGCSDEAEKPPESGIEVGKRIYANVCIACHNGDPTQDGTLGPAVAGASLELLEAKVLRGEYPPGYESRRPGSTMPKYTYLEERIGDLAEYLASVGG